MNKFAFALAFLLTVPSLTHAASPVCGNGNFPCPEPDKDDDGYLSPSAGGVDCDDNDFRIYPGVVTEKGCPAGQTHSCQADGSYTACTVTPVCEASAGSNCKYIDCGAGSDSSGNGSFSSPWKSFKMVGYRVDGTQNPPGFYPVQPGDVVYLKGSGTCADTYSVTSGEPNVVLAMGTSGTASKPITYKRYPGSTAVIDPPFTSASPGHVIYLRSANYIKVDDLDITGSYGAVIYGGPNDHIELSRIRCHDTQGNNNDNIACLNLATNPTNIYLHHSEFSNVYDTAQPGAQNVGLVVFFQGSNNRVEYNRLFYTNSPAYGGPVVGRCLRYKHPGTSGTFTVKGNEFWNCNGYAFENSTAGVRMSNNILVNPPDYLDGGGYGCWDIGFGISYCRDAVVENNTFVNARAFEMQTSGINAGLGTTTFRNNVVLHTAPSYTSENGFFRIARYGSDANFLLFTTVHGLVTSGNCYYNPNTSVMFDYFADTPLTTGAYFNFAQWQGAGFDAGSSVVNPAFDANYAATAGACSGKGWLSPGSQSRPAPPTNLQLQVLP